MHIDKIFNKFSGKFCYMYSETKRVRTFYSVKLHASPTLSEYKSLIKYNVKRTYSRSLNTFVNDLSRIFSLKNQLNEFKFIIKITAKMYNNDF